MAYCFHYGLTEVSRALFSNLHKDDLNAVSNISSGAAVKIVDENGAILNPGQVGEIVLRLPG